MISPSMMNAMMLAQERTDQLRRAERSARHSAQPRGRRSLHLLPSLPRLSRRTPVSARGISPRPGA
ncbi:MAG: hypothetical protein QOC95_2250 [Thermoleophilaceae bacterium]|jgi:hypothetical protein|nr:hypothetical protein [Thermoleophilaceae bacterium]